MARKYYLLDENGTIKSADGSKKYRLLEGQDLYEFLPDLVISFGNNISQGIKEHLRWYNGK